MASSHDSEGADFNKCLPVLTLFSAATCGKAGTAQTCLPLFGPSSEVHLHRPQGHYIQDTQTSVVRLCGLGLGAMSHSKA